jgi:hypothetical protein
MNWKGIVTTLIVVLIAVAVINRVKFLRDIAYPSAAAA